MLDEIRAGNVATVIIKDQSRIGRDVVEVGLLKRTFDEYHVRFIAANDNLDTANGFDIMSIFRDVINEWYVADTSRKIKAVFKSRMEKGLRCSGSVCYGYRASKEEKGEWIIGGETIASIAKALRAGGTIYLRGRNPRHCGRGNVADRTEDTGNRAPRSEAAERPEPFDRASLLRRLRLKTHTPLQPCAREMGGGRFYLLRLPPFNP